MTFDVTFEARVLRKQEDLPRDVVVSPEHVAGQLGAFAAEVWLNGVGPFARNIRPWGKGSDVFFFNLTSVQCQKAGVETEDVCEVWVLECAP